MKGKRLYIVIATLLLLINSGNAQSQTSQRILAKVVEEQTHTPVPFAFVANSKTGIGKETNNNGIFRMDISPSDTLLFRCMGYEFNSWALAEYNLESDTLILTVNSRTYALDEINVIHFRSYAAFKSKVANMPLMETGEYTLPFTIDVRGALAEKKAESKTFGVSIGSIGNLLSKIKSSDQEQYSKTISQEEKYALYNKITSRDNLQYFTQLKGATLDSFIVFLRTKHNFSPSLSEYDMLVQIDAAFDDFIASRSDTITIKH